MLWFSYLFYFVCLCNATIRGERKITIFSAPHPYSGENFGVFPLEQTRLVGVAKSERPRLTNGEIIFEEFQPM